MTPVIWVGEWRACASSRAMKWSAERKRCTKGLSDLLKGRKGATVRFEGYMEGTVQHMRLHAMVRQGIGGRHQRRTSHQRAAVCVVPHAAGAHGL
jgi:hypothetical protein